MTTLPPADFALEDLTWEIGDGLDRHQSDFWAPLIEVTSSYVSNFELRQSVDESILNLWQDSKGDGAAYRDRREELTSQLARRITEVDVSHWIQPRLARLGSRYEFHQNYILRKTTEQAREEFERRREGIRGDGIHGRWVEETVEWIGLAVSSGVVGNLAYDMLKTGWITTRSWRLRDLLRRRRERFDRQVDPDEALAYLVKIAVREQCRRLDFTVPAITDLRFTSWSPGPESVVASVVVTSTEMKATVEIPYSSIETRGILVSISDTR